MIEDFFRLVDDAVRFHPKRSITSELTPHILSASMSALTLQQHEPLIATLHYLHDLLSFGLDRPAVSSFDNATSTNPAELQAAVRQLMASQGAVIVQRILTGMMFTFPADCFLDASTVVMLLFELMPQEAAAWVEGTIQMLPAGSVKPHESEKLMQALRERMMAGDSRRIRSVIQGKLFCASFLVSGNQSILTSPFLQTSQTHIEDGMSHQEKVSDVSRLLVSASAIRGASVQVHCLGS